MVKNASAPGADASANNTNNTPSADKGESNESKADSLSLLPAASGGVVQSKAAPAATSYPAASTNYSHWSSKKKKPAPEGLSEMIGKVWKALDLEALRKFCALEIDDFREYGQRFYQIGKPNRIFYYKDNASPVLAVAHMDSVQSERWMGYSVGIPGETVVYSPVLDDRLGVYIILDLLPKLGIVTDILLTNDEESGGSTADVFDESCCADKKRKFNWMVEFDRTGSDVVTYSYTCKELEELLTDHGFLDVNRGAFTDICRLTHLECKGFNVGVGYKDYHNRGAYALMSQMVYNVACFVLFYESLKDTHLPHDPKSTGYSYSSYNGYGGNYDSKPHDKDRLWFTDPNTKVRRMRTAEELAAYDAEKAKELQKKVEGQAEDEERSWLDDIFGPTDEEAAELYGPETETFEPLKLSDVIDNWLTDQEQDLLKEGLLLEWDKIAEGDLEPVETDWLKYYKWVELLDRIEKAQEFVDTQNSIRAVENEGIPEGVIDGETIEMPVHLDDSEPYRRNGMLPNWSEAGSMLD